MGEVGIVVLRTVGGRAGWKEISKLLPYVTEGKEV